jgi:hypothetical protein
LAFCPFSAIAFISLAIKLMTVVPVLFVQDRVKEAAKISLLQIHDDRRG